MKSKMKLPKKRISAIICTYNRYDLLSGAIESLLQQSCEPGLFNIIVVDNSPVSSEQKKFKKKYHLKKNIFYHVELIKGLSNARNVGAKLANSQIIAYLDDDAKAGADWITTLLGCFDRFGEAVGLVGGHVSPIWPVDRPKWFPDTYLGALSILDWGATARILDDNEWIVGANFAVLTEALMSVGGFNTSLGRVGDSGILLSNEEFDVRERIEAIGYSTVYSPSSSVSHHVDERRLSRGWLRKRMAWQAVSEIFQDEARAFSDLEAKWNHLESVFASLPPNKRTVRGLFDAFDSPNLTREQIGAVFSLTLLLLGGYETNVEKE